MSDLKGRRRTGRWATAKNDKTKSEKKLTLWAGAKAAAPATRDERIASFMVKRVCILYYFILLYFNKKGGLGMAVTLTKGGELFSLGSLFVCMALPCWLKHNLRLDREFRASVAPAAIPRYDDVRNFS